LFVTVNEYLSKLPNSKVYKDLAEIDKEAAVFTEEELLKDHFADKLTDRAVALQVLYMLEGEDEEYAKLKRHGRSN
jgi:hypothetical protein